MNMMGRGFGDIVGWEDGLWIEKKAIRDPRIREDDITDYSKMRFIDPRDRCSIDHC